MESRAQQEPPTGGQPLAGTPPAPEEVRAALDRVLALPEFRVREPGFAARLRQCVFDWLELHLPGWMPSEGAANVAVWLILAVLAVLLALSAWYLVRLWLRREVPSAKGATPADEGDSAQPDAAACFAQADALAAAGDLRGAMAAAFEGLLRALGEGGWARFHPSRVARDYQLELAAKGESARSARRELGEAVALFYPVAFGGRSPALEPWRRLRELARGLGGSR